MSKTLLDINFKLEFAKKLVGGVIVDVENDVHAKIAQKSGARGVAPITILGKDKVQTMPDLTLIANIYDAVAIPIFGKIQIGHTIEAHIMERAGASFVDENENVDKPPDDIEHIDKTKFETPFSCGAKKLGDIVNAVAKGAAIIRLYEKEDANIVSLGSKLQKIKDKLKKVKELDQKQPDDPELDKIVEEEKCPKDQLIKLAKLDKIPIPIFASGFFATPANGAELMKRGFDGVFINTKVFSNNDNPIALIRGICKAVANYKDTEALIAASSGFTFT
ncbi:hypothetical protein J3B02_005090 [Coemansia erecta]|uniref:pyridoxal 5'-phosphate synthase (glutamine hydrolyzing) n=1 Tax=Coemansia asiatica TaxID=1052880 RepID=A0A9W7XKG8_9FUNG|nr:hypothetical protein LPJ64_003725 [Coemansia asiatica]KAJ2844031.1 hypothetical protein J3B02_005090 [Coemansia erecta]KAJ2865879.1 hypothetical protein FB639_005070 [Coemansia asiatica]